MRCTLVPVESREEAAGRQHEGPLGKNGAAVVDPLQVAPGHVCHADGPGRAIQELIAIPANSGKQRPWFVCLFWVGGGIKMFVQIFAKCCERINCGS